MIDRTSSIAVSAVIYVFRIYTYDPHVGAVMSEDLY